MSELTQDAVPSPAPRPKPQRKSDGQDGPPLLTAPPASPSVNTPGKPNAALTEPKLDSDSIVDRNHQHAAHLVVLDAERGIVGTPDGSPMRKKIALCGFASATRGYIVELAKDPEWEIWGLNQLYRHIPRADRWFDIHHNWDQEIVPGTDHRQWARDCGIPFYTQRREEDVPTSVRYPLDAVIGIYQADYFTSTIPYMVSLALMEIDAAVTGQLQEIIRKTPKTKLIAMNVQDILRRLYGEYTIGIFGIDLVVGTEYFHEKPCAEFWLGALAVGRGIQIKIPPQSALCKQHHRYGYDKEPNQFLRTDDIKKHQTAVTAERDEQLKKLYLLEGMMQSDQRWIEMIDLRSRGATVE